MFSLVGVVLLFLLAPFAADSEKGTATPFKVGFVAEESTQKKNAPGYKDFLEGVSYGKQEQYEKAVEAFNRAQGKGLRSFELFLLRGQAYFELGKSADALKDARQAIEVKPRSPYGYSLRAMVHQADKQWDQAIEGLSKGITIVPKAAAGELYRARGISYLQLGRSKDAVNDLSQALQLGVATPLVYYKKGRALAQLGQYQKAIDDFSEALRLEDGHYKSRLDRGWAYGCIGEFKKSILDLDRLVSDKPKDLVARGMRGWVRLETGDVDGGLSDLLYALEHGQRDPLTYLNIAGAWYLKGNFQKAIDANAHALEVKDAQTEAAVYFQKGLILLVAGKANEAKTAYEQGKVAMGKTSERVELQDAIADLREAQSLHKHIAAESQPILQALEEKLSKMPSAERLITKRCQQPRTRPE